MNKGAKKGAKFRIMLRIFQQGGGGGRGKIGKYYNQKAKGLSKTKSS